MTIANTDITYTRILCPVDFSETSRKAFYQAVGYSRLFKAQLVLLHVVERNFAKGFEQVEEEAELHERLEAGVRRRLDELQSDGQLTDDDRDRMVLEIGGGKPWLEIVRYAADTSCDLIVMGTHGHTGMRQIFIGSQAERVVRRSHCHVLCVKPTDYEFDLPQRD